MSKFFLDILNLSITASWLIVAVLATRFIFRKRAPKWVNCLLWSLVGLRLLLPFTIESPFSLSVNREVINTDAVYGEAPADTVPPVDDTIVPPSVNEGGQTQQKPETENDNQNPDVVPEPAPETDKDKEYIQSGLDVLDDRINPVINGAVSSVSKTEKDPIHKLVNVFSYIWLAGVGVMLTYAVIVYFLLKRRVSASVPCENSVRKSERVDTPFILGVFRPRIYLPFGLSEQTEQSVVAHEIAHIKRKDHLIKPLGYAILSVYWFNPLVWVAYILLCRDIESACDEKVIKNMDTEARQVYATALLECSLRRNYIAACPLAFGETGVKNRVKNAMNYRKPAFWVIVSALLVCVTVSVLFLTSPGKAENDISETISEDSRQTESSDTSVTDVSDVTSSDVSEYIGEVSVSDETSLPQQENSNDASADVSEDIYIDHTHSFSTEWSSDVTGHWYACKCGEMFNFGNHTFGEWETIKAATCVSKGAMEQTCSDCGYFSTKAISATRHEYKTKVTLPTATEQGYTTHTCTKCGNYFIDSYTKPYGEADVLTISIKNSDLTCSLSVNKQYPLPETVIIPEKIDGYTVVEIESGAFQEITGLKTVMIPDTVKVIGTYAFSACSDIENITLGNGITSIGSGAFAYCDKINYNVYNNGCYLGTKDNPYYALIKTTSKEVTSCIIHPNTRVIADDAFAGCHYIKTLTIPDKVTEVPIGFALSCERLSTVILHDRITRINESAFFECKSLVNIDIPDSVTVIRPSAFSGCTSLSSITLPKNITFIYESAFSGCTNLKFNEYDNAYYLGTKDNPYYALINAKSKSIQSCKTHAETRLIASGAFVNCEYLSNVSIGNKVSIIGEMAFYRSGLTEIEIPDNVVSLRESAFMECKSLKKVKLGDGITEIELSTFEKCSAMEEIIFGDNVTVIGERAFCGCNLKSIVIPDSVKEIRHHAFYNSSLKSINIPDTVTRIEYSAFMRSSLNEVTLGKGITVIEGATFSECDFLQTVTISSSVTLICKDAFKDCPITDVYYGGTIEQWKEVERPSYYYDPLGYSRVTMHFGS